MPSMPPPNDRVFNRPKSAGTAGARGREASQAFIFSKASRVGTAPWRYGCPYAGAKGFSPRAPGSSPFPAATQQPTITDTSAERIRPFETFTSHASLHSPPAPCRCVLIPRVRSDRPVNPVQCGHGSQCGQSGRRELGRAAYKGGSRNCPAQEAQAQMCNACEMLVAAELTLARKPGLRVFDFWPGYDVVAQPRDGRSAERLSVKSTTFKRGSAAGHPSSIAVHGNSPLIVPRDSRTGAMSPARPTAGRPAGRLSKSLLRVLHLLAHLLDEDLHV